MEINFRKNNEWNVITITLEDFKFLTKELIEKSIKLKFNGIQFENKIIDIVDTKQSSVVKNSGNTQHFVSIYFAILDKE